MFLIWEISVPYTKSAKFSADKRVSWGLMLCSYFIMRKEIANYKYFTRNSKMKENRSVTGEGDDAVSYFTNVNEILRSEGRLAAKLMNPFPGGN